MPTSPFKVGDSVRVNIRDAEHWSVSAFRALQGQAGVVESISTTHSTGVAREKPYVCVRFPSPLPSFWKNGSPISAHHFDADELELLP